jgi:hypothetical protein
MARRSTKPKRRYSAAAQFDLEQGLRLLRAFLSIEDSEVRQQLLDHIERVAEGGAVDAASSRPDPE